MMDGIRTCFCLAGALALPLALTAAPALAQTSSSADASAQSLTTSDASTASASPRRIDISANLSFFSDYRFRGASLTDKQPAIQGGVDVTLPITDSFSAYLGNWNSTLKKRTGYGGTEMDWYGGVTGKVKAVGWKVGAIGYTYPGKNGLNYYEIQTELNSSIGPASVAVGTYLAPKQKAYGNITGVYMYSNASYAIPKTPVTLKASLGYEKNSVYTKRGDGPGRKLDWSLGATATWKMFNFGVSYIDTNRKTPFERKSGNMRKESGATVVGNIGVVF